MVNMEESLLKTLLGGMRNSLTSGDNLNNYRQEGKYKATTDAIASSCENSPTNNAFIMNVYHGSNSIVQQVIPFSGDSIFMRRYQFSNQSWRNWYAFTGSVVG